MADGPGVTTGMRSPSPLCPAISIGENRSGDCSFVCSPELKYPLAAYSSRIREMFSGNEKYSAVPASFASPLSSALSSFLLPCLAAVQAACWTRATRRTEGKR